MDSAGSFITGNLPVSPKLLWITDNYVHYETLFSSVTTRLILLFAREPSCVIPTQRPYKVVSSLLAHCDVVGGFLHLVHQQIDKDHQRNTIH